MNVTPQGLLGVFLHCRALTLRFVGATLKHEISVDVQPAVGRRRARLLSRRQPVRPATLCRSLAYGLRKLAGVRHRGKAPLSTLLRRITRATRSRFRPRNIAIYRANSLITIVKPTSPAFFRLTDDREDHRFISAWHKSCSSLSADCVFPSRSTEIRCRTLIERSGYFQLRPRSKRAVSR
jgi:hypothetical protein